MGEAWDCRKIILMDEFDGVFQHTGARAIRFNIFAARNFAEIFFDIGLGLCNVEVTRNCNGHIIRHIPARIEIFRVLQRGCVQIFQRPYDLPIIRMVGRIKGFADNIPIMSVRGIIDTLAFFIFDDLLFIIDDILGDGFNEPAQLIRFRPDDFFQRVFRDGLEILRHIIRRKPIRAFAAYARIHGV